MTSWSDEWFDMEGAAYLNVAGQGPIPRVAVRAVQQSLEWKKFPHRIPEDVQFALPERVRASIARMIGAGADDVAITAGASAGMAAVAMGIDWKPDDEVLIAKGEFPALFATFMPLAYAGKLRVKVVEPAGRFLTADDFIRELGPATRLVATSLVRFDNAARLDAPRMAKACHQQRAFLLLDAAQCVGAMPLDVSALGVDFLTASGYKWLLGPYGTGFFWARPELLDRMSPSPANWMAIEGATKFDTLGTSEFQLARWARRLDAPETANFFNLSALDASLTFLLRAGVETVWQHNRRLIDGMIERLPLDRCVLASPANADERGPYVCVMARKRETTHVFFEQLCQAGVIVSLREGALRIAPHLFNSERDMDRLLSILSV